LSHESVLSDVHLRHDANGEATVFAWRSASVNAPPHGRDADGDCLVVRRPRRNELHVHHSLETKLLDVGLQVWRGALLLGDKLVSDPSLVRDAVVLELGAGVGLCGLLAAHLGARSVFLTDVGDSVLGNAQTNVQVNRLHGSMRVRCLDWSEPWHPEKWHERGCSKAGEGSSGSEAGEGCSEGSFEWCAADRELLKECTLVLAADCVYDDALTDSLLDQLAQILEWLPAHQARALVAIERRVNFCVDSLSARAPAVDHFLQGLQARGRLALRSLPCDFARAFEYERPKRHMELFELTSQPYGTRSELPASLKRRRSECAAKD